ncbi:MAG: hypothetical protein EOP02_03590 [Proteobacteria bacterium]|nr:MAG: hypothetical protein EOP02_03590 [Pseudomonadota bacterium]
MNLLATFLSLTFFRVPIYSASSWASLVSLKAAFWIGPFRDVYEAFTLYAFFQLLINFLGGERSLIIMMHGRAPVSHLWPMNHCLPKVDISDPHTFLTVKRGILQYAWIKPILAISTIIMKATNTYQEGYIGVTSGYLWSGIIYNVSITLSLYALALFWVCMSQDLKPFRPMPKFLCIKGIIFASLALLLLNHALQFGKSLAESGRIPPVLAVWTPFVLFGLMSLWMFLNSLAWPGDNPVSRAVLRVENLIERGRARRPAKALA